MNNLFTKILNFYKTAKISVEELKPLEKFITSEENPKFFFTMTEINKIGINPQSKYNTPLGVYAYPLTKEYYTKLITNTLPFAGDKQYINLFSISDKTNNLSNYNSLEHDVSILKKYYKDNDFETIKEVAFEEAYKDNDISKFWNLTRILSKTPLKWNGLFRQLGYTNFYDPGEKIIHTAEPTQCVILDPRIIIPIETFLNPYFVESLKIKKPITNISEQDVNNILKTKNKDTISRFDNSIFRSLKPYQIMYILENNLLLNHIKGKIKNNIYIDKDPKLLKHVLKQLLKNANDYIFNQVFKFALKNGIYHIGTDSLDVESGEFLLFNFDNIIYYRNKKIHREDGPAIEWSDGSKEWYKYGKNHRADGPAIERVNGDKIWYTNGLLHREDGPALEYADGRKCWYKNGKVHREDGPAIEYASGEKSWYLNDKYYGVNDEFTNESWKEFIKTQKK